MYPRQCWLLLALVASGSAFAQVDTTKGGAVTASTLSARYAIESASTANVRIVANPAGGTKTVFQMRARSTDAKVGGFNRTEVVPLKEAMGPGLRWYALSVYMPATWTLSAQPAVLAQIAPSAAASPLPAPLTIVARGTDLELSLNANHRALSGTTDPATAANSAGQVFKLDTLKTAKWYCFVARNEWSPTLGVGTITLWMNGEKVYTASRAYNAFSATTLTPRVGLMYPGVMGAPDQTLYTDFIWLGGVTTYVEQMYAKTPCAPVTMVKF